MPVTIKVASHEANLVTTGARRVEYPKQVLKKFGKRDQCEILQSSLDNDSIPPNLLARYNGFVDSVTEAYNQHHHLAIRPEDIWLSVISQFSLYVNTNSEDLRGHFVAHEGQKDLVIKHDTGDRYSVDFADFALQIKELISQYVVDEGLRAWITPSFSTTTQEDVVIASIMMMGTPQKYFRYHIEFECGIPSVTLLGIKEDYEQILERVEKLSLYGQQAAEFRDLLKPILRHFIRSFDEPEHAEIQAFWGKICRKEYLGSGGPDAYSGWITAFCFWNNEGKRQISGQRGLSMDGVNYGQVWRSQIPNGFTTVPVHIHDNGEDVEAEMLAGSVGINCTSSMTSSADGTMGLDTMQNHHGWFIYEKGAADEGSASSEAEDSDASWGIIISDDE